MILFARPLIRPFPVNLLRDPENPLAQLKLDPSQARLDGYREPPNYLVPTLTHIKNGEEHSALLKLLAEGPRG